MLIRDDSSSIFRTPSLLSVTTTVLPASPDDEPTEPFSVSNSLGVAGMVDMATTSGGEECKEAGTDPSVSDSQSVPRRAGGQCRER